MAFDLHDLDLATGAYREQQLNDHLNDDDNYPDDDDLEDARYHAMIDDLTTERG